MDLVIARMRPKANVGRAHAVDDFTGRSAAAIGTPSARAEAATDMPLHRQEQMNSHPRAVGRLVRSATSWNSRRVLRGSSSMW